jgi:hypothetical protein
MVVAADPMTLLAIREQKMGGSTPVCLSVVALFGPLFEFANILHQSAQHVQQPQIFSSTLYRSKSVVVNNSFISASIARSLRLPRGNFVVRFCVRLGSVDYRCELIKLTVHTSLTS